MKKAVLLIIPVFAFCISFKEALRSVEDSLILKSAKELQKASEFAYEAQKGKLYPSLDLSLDIARLQETPTVRFMNMKLPMGDKNRFEGEISIKYPIFSGFAISSLVDEAKLRKEIAKLKVSDLKRELILKISYIYSSALSLKEKQKALEEAKKAVSLSYKKALGLYKNGLLPISEVYNIRAKKFDIQSQIAQTESEKKKLLNSLSYILDREVKGVEEIGKSVKLLKKEEAIRSALENRADLKSLRKLLKIDQKEIELAKSAFYPFVSAAVGLKRRGKDLSLNGDGYTNANENYAALRFSWNLFKGFSDKNGLEAARAKKIASFFKLKDYEKRVVKEIKDAFSDIEALEAKIKSAQEEVKAREEYYKLTYGRFENKFASADELSRAISDLAASKAKFWALKNELFYQTVKVRLLGAKKIF